MAVPEAQLETWSKLGSVAQSSATYATVRRALESADPPYAGKDYTIYLQGSYCNDTNIYSDSDVDVVMRLDSTFYKDLSSLSAEDQAAYSRAFSKSDYGYSEFKRDVIAHLVKQFGAAAKPGGKAVFIEGAGARRDADVLVAAKYRRYHSFRSLSDQSYTEGISFLSADGTQIINYPKQHSDNCTAKHQRTSEWFKPTVRIMKNMRNRMVSDGLIKVGLAPSYFLEGMMYNVPRSNFGTSYEDTVVKGINWLLQTDRSKLVCANEQFYLLNDSSPVTWRAAECDAFLNAVVRFWKEW